MNRGATNVKVDTEMKVAHVRIGDNILLYLLGECTSRIMRRLELRLVATLPSVLKK
jgi:hypothetical protein